MLLPRPQHPVRLAFLVVAALASAVLFFRGRGVEPKPSGPRLAMGYYVKEARLLGTGTDGKVLYRLRAASGRQDLAGGAIALEDIEVLYEPATEVPWQLRAQHGRVPPGGNIIVLTGDVVARTQAATPPTEIRTDYLELDPDSYVARTARDVTIERARDTLRARGLLIFLKEDRLQLRSEVRGTFRPPRRS